MKNESRRMPRGHWSGLYSVGLALVIACLWLGTGNLNYALAQGGAAGTVTPAESKKGGSADVKASEAAPVTNDTKTPDAKQPAQSPTASESKLQVVDASRQTIWNLVEGKNDTVKLLVTTDADGGVNIAHIAFEPQEKQKAPAEAAQVRVIGPAQGYPGMLKRGEQMEITLDFPPHRSTGEYTANLTYTTAEPSSAPIKFHLVTVEVGMMRKWLAVAIASLFCLVIVLLTFLVSKKGNKDLNFFQSPDGGYSASKFQTWIWTLVIVFAYSYRFLWRDGDVQLPASTWALLGISVVSTGIAKTIAVKQDENKGGSVSATQPPVAPPTPPTPAGGPAAAAIVTALTAGPRPNWLTSMLSDAGQLSVMRIQMIAWTMVTATMYLVYLFQQQALWDVPSGLLILMGISHTGYLVDKGSAPVSDMKCETLQPNSVKADPATKKNPQTNIVILGQNFKPGVVKCLLGGIPLTLTTQAANRIEASLPAGSLDAGMKYDLAVQQPGENSEVMTNAFEVTL